MRAGYPFGVALVSVALTQPGGRLVGGLVSVSARSVECAYEFDSGFRALKTPMFDSPADAIILAPTTQLPVRGLLAPHKI